jgi:ribokinase
MKNPRPKITVVGSFAVGLTLRAPRFPVKGETLIGSDFDMGPGGKGSNQAVGAARLGAESHLVAVIGDDLFGEVAVKLYQHEGVGTAHLRRTAERNTGVGFITLNAEGDNHIVLDMGANHLLSPADVDAAEDLIASSDAVLSVLEIAPETAARGMALARRHGAISILNPAPAQSLSAEHLANVDVLTPNESELRLLLGLAPDDPTDTLELAHRLQGRGVKRLVVTRGERGALIVTADGATQPVPGVRVNVVDSTGAGDAFTCALGVALAEGQPLVDAARFAAGAGALACTRLGVIPALPTRAEVEALLRRAA